jgi:hypothetical protein
VLIAIVIRQGSTAYNAHQMEFEGKCSADTWNLHSMPAMPFKNIDKRKVAPFNRHMLLRGLKHDVLNCFIFRTKQVNEKFVSIRLSILLISHV